MKKQLIPFIVLCACLNAQEEKLPKQDIAIPPLRDSQKNLDQVSIGLDNKNLKKEPIPKIEKYEEESLDIEKYQKVSLMDVVLETVSSSDLIKSAREKVIQSEIKLQDGISQYYPTLNFEYGYGKNRVSPAEKDVKFKYFNDRNYKLVLNQNIYAGGTTKNDIKSLKKKLDLAKNQYYIALSEQVQKAIKAYFDVVFSYRTVHISEQNMEKLKKILDIVTVKYENGAVSIGDLTAIKASVSNAQTQMVKVKSKFIESLRYYEYIVGEKYAETLPYEKNFNINVSTFELLYDRAVKRNRDLLSYYESIAAEKYALKSEKGNFAPKLDFEVSVDNIMEQDGNKTDDLENRQETVNGKFKLTYNLYNGGRDKNKILSSYSQIREMNYKLYEEKKKLKWNISKLFTSIKSTNESLKSNISEVISLRKMVEAYWEEFKLGEQDLQALLQGQKQLNSAETELIKYESSNIVDFFTLLGTTGDLLAFFDIDPEHPKFIDFAKSNYVQDVYIDDKFLNEKERIEKQAKIKEEEKMKELLVSKAKQDENIEEFTTKFVNSSDSFYTIDIGLFPNIKDANSFIKSNKLDANSFAYSIVNGVNIFSKVTYGIFENLENAKMALENLKNSEFDKQLNIKQVKAVKKLYNDYINGLKVEVKPLPPEIKIVEKVNTVERLKQEKKEKEFVYSEEFRNKFMQANPNYFTINVASFKNEKDLQNILKTNESLYKNSWAYNYMDITKLTKWVYGVYEDYPKAQNALNLFVNQNRDKYYPVIQKIGKEQEQYMANLKYNIVPEKPKAEYEVVKVSSKIEYKNPIDLESIELNKEPKLNDKVKDLLPKPEVIKEEDKVITPEVDVLPIENSVLPPKLNETQIIKSKEDKLKQFNNEAFKKSFLEAPKTYYSVNIGTLFDVNKVQDFINNYKLNDKVFVFEVGEKLDSIKIMYGVFKNRDEALNAIKALPAGLVKTNKPYIEKIFRKQDLYKLYHLSARKPNEQVVTTSVVEESIVKGRDINDVVYFDEQDSSTPVNGVLKLNNSNLVSRVLSASSSYYTIDVTLINDINIIENFLNFYKIKKNSVLIPILDESGNVSSVNIIYGIYKDEEGAVNALKLLPQNLIKANNSKVVKIKSKQQMLKVALSSPEEDIIEDEPINVTPFSNKIKKEENIKKIDKKVIENKSVKVLPNFIEKRENTTNIVKETPKQLKEVENIKTPSLPVEPIIVAPEDDGEENFIPENSVQKNISLIEKDKKTLIKNVEKSMEITKKDPADKYNNEEFKFEFLNSPAEYYTVNFTTLNDIKKVPELLDYYGLENKSFVFTFGKDNKSVAIAYGIYDSKEKAMAAIADFSANTKKLYKPFVEKISVKQNKYKENHLTSKESN